MTGELTKAHAAFLKQVGTIQEAETNDFHHSKYASLEGVLAVVNPVLIANGLSVHQVFDHTSEGKTVLKTILRHTSGEELISSALYPETSGKNPLHDWGKNCTYMRRYTLLAILGICTGIVDDDGNTRPTSLNSNSTTSTQPKQPTKAPPSRSSNLPEPADKAERDRVVDHIMILFNSNKNAFTTLKTAYYNNFNLPSSVSFSDHIQQKDHLEFISQWFIKNQSLVKP